MRLLVTGGAGFIGANFVNYWLGRHPRDEIVVLDKLTYAGDVNRLHEWIADSRLEFVHGDICDEKCVRYTMTGVDTVVHFAAETHVDRSLSGLEAEKLFMRTNYEGTYTLLHAAKDSGVARFHHISTDEVFGDLDFDAALKFHEAYPYNPNNPYSISKAAADFAIRAFYRTFNFPVTISNCSNNYGPYQTPEKMIPRSISLLLEGQPIQLYTDEAGVPGKNVRDWLHVDDHCSAIEAILEKGEIGETYAVGADGELTNLELVKQIMAAVSQMTGKEYSFEKNVVLVKDRPGHDRRYAIDSTKLTTKLGWKPKHSFESGFQQAVGWYLGEEGREWIQSLKDSTREVRADQGRAASTTKERNSELPRSV